MSFAAFWRFPTVCRYSSYLCQQCFESKNFKRLFGYDGNNDIVLPSRKPERDYSVYDRDTDFCMKR
jgi:hypothetical protein